MNHIYVQSVKTKVSWLKAGMETNGQTRPIAIPRCDKHCKNICTSGGHFIPWVDDMRYLGLFIVQSRTFKSSLDHAKRSFYRAANGIFGSIGRMASEEVILELIKTKCLPILLYGL